MMTVGLKELNRNVVETGDGINDVTAIVQATVGLAMGSGCSAAKEVSDIILTNDDFEATLKSVMWGRNIYHNIGRFLQFQVTVNISALLTVAIGSIKLMESPLSAVQLLWINLIMDTFAAFALSTEPPLPSIIVGPPLNADAQLLTPVIWRQIIGMSIWNTIVMTLMIFFGPLIAGLTYKVTDTANGNDDKKKHLTMIFTTFVMLQVFNEINCRKVGRRDFNVFESILHNKYFLIIVGGTVGIQYLMI
jgi:Ca2+ transporting ATPase